MLKLHTSSDIAHDVSPEPGQTSEGPVSNAEKARALIALLEGKSADGDQKIPAEHLRAWARDLVRTVETRGVETGPRPDGAGRVAAEPAKPSNGPTKLFSSAAPKLMPTPQAAPQTRAAPANAAHGSRSHNAQSSAPRLTLSAPQVHEPKVRQARPASVPALPPPEIRTLVAKTIDPATMAREHPAIIAMAMAGKPSIEQAAALRSLPSGQVRAVHRALRQLEG